MAQFKFIISISIAVILAFSTPAISDNLQKTAEKIAEEVLSPFCPGRSLQDCPSQASSDLKSDILLKLQKGQSKEEVMNFLFNEYGDKIRAVPPIKGFGVLAWALPIVFIIIGIIAIFRWLNSIKQTEELSDQKVKITTDMEEKINSLIEN